MRLHLAGVSVSQPPRQSPNLLCALALGRGPLCHNGDSNNNNQLQSPNALVDGWRNPRPPTKDQLRLGSGGAWNAGSVTSFMHIRTNVIVIKIADHRAVLYFFHFFFIALVFVFV